MDASGANHNAIIIQPPLVQLNTAYPSGAYLCAFFKSVNVCASWHDLSIELVRSIFCSEGLESLFSLSQKNALSLAERFEKRGEDFAAQNLRLFVMQKDRWICWIDSVMKILCDGSHDSSRELAHRFVFSPFVPRGMRMESYLESLSLPPSADDARNLASAALEDLADYIRVAFDPEFSLIRYAESVAVSGKSFGDIERALSSPVLSAFYKGVLERVFAPGSAEDKKIQEAASLGKRTLVCVSVPFAGTFTPALFTGSFLKRRYGGKVFVAFGGGFVNTELREFADAKFGEYADCLSLDRGYGSYRRLLESGILSGSLPPSSGIYKMRLWDGGCTTAPKESDGEMEAFEDSATASLVPDYSDIDFSLYPRMADDTNPMQRLWSDGSWIKAYLAHGCYWHRCAFCDVTLDYVRSYKMTCVESLYEGLLEQAQKKGVCGIHFVDEALPPAALVRFAKCNARGSAQGGIPLSFWGNVRFEKVYSRDMADFLSFAGLIGVSGGIEIATGGGLDKISKGTDLDSIVGACCAFKEAGILVHAYMIYGYFGEDERDTVNSMETLRQFFELGLLDSCFWHKFVLTRHSRIYDEWKRGLHPSLHPFEEKGAGLFAKNGLHFEGEEASNKFGRGLNAALNAWMHGEKTGMSVCKWFDFKVPEPTVPRTLVQSAVQKYEKRRDGAWKSRVEIKKCAWLCSTPLVRENRLEWHYMQELYSAPLPPKAEKSRVKAFLCALEQMSTAFLRTEPMEEFAAQNPAFVSVLQAMRGKGLVQL